MRRERPTEWIPRYAVGYCEDPGRLAEATEPALVQLTTDKVRADAHRFYERLGFVASPEGLKMSLLR